MFPGDVQKGTHDGVLLVPSRGGHNFLTALDELEYRATPSNVQLGRE